MVADRALTVYTPDALRSGLLGQLDHFLAARTGLSPVRAAGGTATWTRCDAPTACPTSPSESLQYTSSSASTRSHWRCWTARCSSSQRTKPSTDSWLRPLGQRSSSQWRCTLSAEL